MSFFRPTRRQGDRHRRGDVSSRANAASAARHRCVFEQMEPRRLLAVDIVPIHVGAVYFETAGDNDSGGDRFEITFTGGVAGTQLTQLTIETDKNSNGQIDPSECLFDTESAAPGDFGWAGFEIVSLGGVDSVQATVVDGGDAILLAFDGFDPGDRLVFTIDVDEQGSSHPNAVAEGDEFEDSRFRARFEADHYYAAEGVDAFKDEYDYKLLSDLNLPADRYTTPPAESVASLTAGAVFAVTQEPLPITLSGTVYEDLDLDLIRDAGESGLAGVSLTLYVWDGQNYVTTGRTTHTLADGTYAFTDVEPGTYRVVETQPSGYLSVGATAGTVDGLTRGAASSADVITDVALLGGEDSVHNDFAEVRPASLSGHVYHDVDNDGVFDPGETGIGQVLVRVEWMGGDTFPPDDEFPDDEFPDDDLFPWDIVAQDPIEVYTNADGFWSVGNLMPGEYRVTEVTPVGYIDGLDAAGSAGGAAHNPGDLIDGVVLAAAQAGINYDFGELLPGRLCGYVYVDANDNLQRDDTDPGIPGVQLVLLDADGNPTGDVVWTDANGLYCFTDLVPGTYGIREIHPTEYVDGVDTPGTLGGVAHNPGDLIDDIHLGSGQWGKQNNFGERERVSLSGYVWEDDDNDGLRESGEAGIGGVTVELLDAYRNPTGITRVTDANGYYIFDLLEPGVYGVAETQPTAYKDGLDAVGTAGGIAHNPGDRLTEAALVGGFHAVEYNFGELRPALIAGNVFVDLDGDCIRDAGETPIPGVTIHLVDAEGNRIATTKTAANGTYQFVDLAPGTYGLEEIQPSNYLDGCEKVGSAGGIVPSNDRMAKITLAPGTKGVDYNFCELRPASISGYVFQDGPAVVLFPGQTMPQVASIRDGQRTADDQPIAGVTLQLCDGSGAPELDARGNPITTKTDANGYYEFTGLAPGVYSVIQVHPEGYIDGIDTPGSLGGLAVNAHEPLDPLTLGLLAVDPKDDAILQIVVSAGETAVSYNFSEVQVQQNYIPPIPPPPRPPIPLPAVPTVFEPQPMLRSDHVLVTMEVPSHYGGGGVPPGFAWHLSVINAGYPRQRRDNADVVEQALPRYFNPVAWVGTALDGGQWSLADAEGRVVEDRVFGMPGAIPVTGDFNGDGIDEIGVFLDGQWFLDLNGNGVWDEGDFWAQLGDEGDLPVTGDWDGDGKDDIGIFGKAWVGDPRAVAVEAGLPDSQNQPTGRYKNLPPAPEDAPQRKRIMKSTSEGTLRADVIDHVFLYGAGGDKAVAGDFNGDGVATVGIFRNGSWFLDVDGNGRWSAGDVYVEGFGQRGDLPVVGDFNRDGIDELGVYRNGTWHLDTNGDRQLDSSDAVIQLGGADDRPVVGDFDGDGVDQIGVYNSGPVVDRQVSR
ncbi:MAG: carboxypeptidase regulatory-like domain-containing protein [Pirellulales bacterium]|nr:carboxypeptidase regulatory-like domain-containing protein [Pirellulales bacterium]